MAIDNKNLEIVLFNAFLPGHKLKQLCCWTNQVDKPDWIPPKDYGCIVTMWAYSAAQNKPFSDIILVISCLASHQNSS